MCFIRLDKKGRLVLPAEIRQAIGIETNGKIRLSVSAAGPTERNTVILTISRASDSDIAAGISFSRNGKYVKKEGLK